MLPVILILCCVQATIQQQIITASNYENDISEDIVKKQQYQEDDFEPDVYLTTPQIIRRHGYEAVSYVITTEDGYLLTLHRIPANRNGKLRKHPIFIHHGAFGSSSDFVTSKNKSLAFVLSDLGYDVWLGNTRGTVYSEGHVSLSPESIQFWNFSFHEMGIYDLPASFKYIKDTTGGQKIIYIGHSMGTTMFYAFASTLPDVAENYVEMMIGLAPVAFMRNVRSPIRLFAPFANDINWISKYLGLKKFVLNQWLLDFLRYDCELLNFNKEVCREIIFLVFGYDEDQLEKNMVSIILGHDPAGMSIKTLVHYMQEIHNGGDFRRYDYGEDGNRINYGTPTPPSYNLSNIRVPTYFMYSDNDLMVDVNAAKELAQKVGNGIGSYEVPLKTFNHIDFLWAKDVIKLVYNNLTSILENFS